MIFPYDDYLIKRSIFRTDWFVLEINFRNIVKLLIFGVSCNKLGIEFELSYQLLKNDLCVLMVEDVKWEFLNDAFLWC